ncbi:MAG: hypothetical protein R3D33_03345 [Hyphomicrobiaceae bacterium]
MARVQPCSPRATGAQFTPVFAASALATGLGLVCLTLMAELPLRGRENQESRPEGMGGE